MVAEVELAMRAIEDAFLHILPASRARPPRVALQRDVVPSVKVEREVGDPKDDAGDNPAEGAAPVPVFTFSEIPLAGI